MFALSATPPDTPAAHGEPLFSARFKTNPEDFCVREQLSIDFVGTGEHLYLHIEKIGRNTSDLVKALSRCFGVAKKDIGVAGLKDKHAITSQWVSVLTPLEAEPLVRWLESADAPPFRLLASQRHSKKLRTGAHTGNRFDIRLNDVQPLFYEGAQARPDFEQAVDERVQQLVRHGFPNYFGPQRFGSAGNNLASAVRWLTASEKISSLSRDKRSLYLSTVRSAAFNRVLAARVQAHTWNQLRPGEVCVLNGSQSVFTVGDEEFTETRVRMSEGDVHPGAPLIGRGEVLSTGQAREIDEAVLNTDEHYTALLDALVRLRVDSSHRATRALCHDLEHRWLDENTLAVSMSLARGVFATTLLGELFTERTR